MSSLLVSIDRSQPGVAVVLMRRADKRNALNLKLLQQLVDALQSLELDSSCRVLVLCGEGPVFCAGLDLIEASQQETSEASAEAIRQVLAGLRQSSKITIGAAQGAAMAGGAGLLAACDLVIASDDLKLGFPEVRRGMVAGLVSKYLAMKVSDGDLRQLLFVAEPISAQRAQQMGLVQWIVPAAQLVEQARNVAAKILMGGPEAQRETKQLLDREPASLDFKTLQELHERVRSGAESREGFAAFRDRREPNWIPQP